MWEFIPLTVLPFWVHPLWSLSRGHSGGHQQPPPPPLPRMGTEGCEAVGRRQGLGGGCPPLQFLMIFLSKGLQGERGLRGLTGEKGEPVRGGGRGW